MSRRSLLLAHPSAGAPRMAIFFSPLLRAVQECDWPIETPGDWLQWLRRDETVKPAEIDWIGLEHWMSLQDEFLPRLDLLHYLRGNTIALRERVLTEGGVLERGELVEGAEAEPFAVPPLRSRWPPHEEETSPGGTNYRELLLFMPALHLSGRNRPAMTADQQKRWDYVTTELRRLPSHLHGRGRGERWRRLAVEHDVLSAQVYRGRPREPFRNPDHYVDENVVVHARLKDRRGPSGERILFVEEVQSDLAARWCRADAGDVADEVPETPFDTAGACHLMAMRLLREVVEEGYDGIAWTSAAMQADRWGLTFSRFSTVYDKQLRRAFDTFARRHRGEVRPRRDLPDFPAVQVWSLDVTPALRQAASDPLPLF